MIKKIIVNLICALIVLLLSINIYFSYDVNIGTPPPEEMVNN